MQIKRISFFLLVFAFTFSFSAQAQSASDVIDAMLERHDEQMAGINDYTLITDRYTTYFKRAEDGRTFKTRTDWDERGMFQGQTFGVQAHHQDVHQLNTLRENAQYAGRETVDGREAHVLITTGDAFMEAAEHQPPEGQHVGEMRIFIDAQDYVPLRIEYNAVIESDGAEHRMNPHIVFSDHRNIEGMIIPFRTEMRMENLDAGLSPEERQEAQQQLAELELQLEEAGGMQRRILQRALGGTLERLREVLADGVLSFAIEVQDVHVNTGLTDDFFEEASEDAS